MSMHQVWATKYHYTVSIGNILIRCRDLPVQICNAKNVHILKGGVNKNHLHLHIEYPYLISINKLVNKTKRQTFYLLQQIILNITQNSFKKIIFAFNLTCGFQATVIIIIYKF